MVCGVCVTGPSLVSLPCRLCGVGVCRWCGVWCVCVTGPVTGVSPLQAVFSAVFYFAAVALYEGVLMVG